jgi:hypothetical protein
MLHPSPRCVAEIRTVRIDPDTDADSHGIASGYLVADRWVLTAAHVVRDAVSVRVWVNPPADLASGEANVEHPGIVYVRGVDWALVPVTGHVVPDGFVPVVFASFERESTEAVPVTSMGLPRHRLRDAPTDPHAQPAPEKRSKMRPVLAASGQIIPASGYNTTTTATPAGLTMTFVGGVPDGSELSDTQAEPESVWSGMSGAAVWSGRLLVGVVTRHEEGAGSASLTVDPVPDSPDDTALSVLPQLESPKLVPSTARELDDTYRQIALDLAPTVLADRADELAFLDDFATDTGRQWWWWEAEAFAGKTALIAWWVGHRPTTDRPQHISAEEGIPIRADREGVVVVSCFLRRTRRHDMADHVLQDWADQLRVLAPTQQVPEQADPQGLVRLRQLIAAAAAQCQRLLLIVDGLDEYSPFDVSVTEWLPATLPPNTGLLVTSRKGVRNGLDQHDGVHPLKTQRHPLTASDAASAVREAAAAEIRHAAYDGENGDMLRRILGLMVAAGAPLTVDELVILVNRGQHERRYPHDVTTALDQRLSRTITTDLATDELSFTHEVLPEVTRDHLARDIPQHLVVLQDWADQHAEEGWPKSTPAYLLHGYPRMLTTLCVTDRGQLPRLVDLVTNRARHDRLRADTGGDTAALHDVAATIQLLTTDPARPGLIDSWEPGTCTHPSVDLDSLTAITWHRDNLYNRNINIPADLPALWVLLGDTSRATSVANGIPGRARHWGLLAIARTLASLGRTEEAKRVATSIEDSWSGAHALIAVAGALARAGQLGDAERLVGTMARPHVQVEAWATIAKAVSAVGRVSEAARIAMIAEQTASTLEDPWRERGANFVVHAYAAAGCVDDAERVVTVAQSLSNRFGSGQERLEAWAAVAQAYAGAGRAEDAARIVAITERIAPGMMNYPRSEERPLALAHAFSHAGLLDDAERVASTIEDPFRRGRSLAQLSQWFVGAGRVKDAQRILAAAERTVITPIGQDQRYERRDALVALAAAFARAGRVEDAERTAHALEGPGSRTNVLVRVAESLALACLFVEAERIANTIDDPKARVQALVAVAHRLARRGLVDDSKRIAITAEQIAASADDPIRRSLVLASLADALVLAGRSDDARRIATAAQQIALTVGNPLEQSEPLSAVARALAKAGLVADAERVVTTIQNRVGVTDAQVEIACAFAGAGLVSEAERVANSIQFPLGRAEKLAAVAQVLADAGLGADAERVAASAEGIATTIDKPIWRAQALAVVASAFARVGLTADARRIATSAERAAAQHRIPVWSDWSSSQEWPPYTNPTIEAIFQEANASADIVQAFVDAGRIDDAQRNASSAERRASKFEADDYGWQAHLRTVAAGALACAGLVDAAERMASSLDELEDRVDSFVEVVRGLIRAGRVADATRIAATTERMALAFVDNQLDRRVKVLVAIARALAEGGSIDRSIPGVALQDLTAARRESIRLVGVVSSLGEWSDALPALGALKSSALVVLHDLVLDQVPLGLPNAAAD